MSKPSEHKNLDNLPSEKDAVASSRKKDHIELAFQSQVAAGKLDERFYYEPLLAGHPEQTKTSAFEFLGKKMRVPIWVSSMTGGTEEAHTINHNLARACRDFGMGMGLGSCRSLLYNDDRLPDFDLRKTIGDDLPFYANLGIAQIEQLLERKEVWKAEKLVETLRADGLIIHVNPFQEWLQPEGDHFGQAPIATIEQLLEQTSLPLIVKEVGQGMGRESLKALFQLPLQAIDFAASGGTNFSLLELLRSTEAQQAVYQKLAHIGHSADDMVDLCNELISDLGKAQKCTQVIISGGVKDFLDGYYLMKKLNLPSIYGQASGFLKHARGDYQQLYDYVSAQVEGLAIANSYLSIRK